MKPTVKGINNPGNIRQSGVKFKGEIPSPDNFKAFSSLAFGYRAILKIFDTYQRRGTDTLRKALFVYAPPADNNPTSAYLDYISKGLNVAPDTSVKEIIYSDKAIPFLRLLSRFEQGKGWKDNEEELKNGVLMFNNKPLITPKTGGAAALLVLIGIGLYLSRQ